MITFLELINLQYLTVNYSTDGHFDGQIFHPHGRNEILLETFLILLKVKALSFR